MPNRDLLTILSIPLGPRLVLMASATAVSKGKAFKKKGIISLNQVFFNLSDFILVTLQSKPETHKKA